MTIQVNGNYDYFRTDYEERVKEKQAVLGVEKAEKAEKAAEEQGLVKLSESQDEYISSEKSEKKPTGLYRVGQDENGSRKIFFDAPKADHAVGKGARIGGNSQGKPSEICVGNTDKVDREVKKLKEKKQELEQQIQSAFGNEKKIRELEKKLTQVEQELSQKDNDTYRKQHSVFI